MTQELALIEDIKEENYPVIYGRSGLDHFYEKVKTEVSSEVPSSYISWYRKQANQDPYLLKAFEMA